MSASEDRIEVEFAFADLPLRRLMLRVHSFHRPNRAAQNVVSVAAWLVLFFGFLGLLQLGNGYPAEGPEFAMIGLAVGMVATVLVLSLMNRVFVNSTLSALTTARSRRGPIRTVLDADGVGYHGYGLSVHQSWANIEEVVESQDVTMIMPSRAEFYPVPHANLPAGITPEILLGRIAAWRKTAEDVK
ncbi:MAG: hypothetical protein ACK47C_01765 [Paracoccaceae bacterium]|jgi:hypothetical protein